MSKFKRIRQQALLREAEGYLDLVLALGDQSQLAPEHRALLASRALACLDKLPPARRPQAQEYFLRGQALRLIDRHREAIEPLHVATELEPDNVRAWLALGWCYKRVRRLDLAIESLENALEADPNQATIHYNLACYWSLAKNVQMAVAYLARAFDMDDKYRALATREPDFDPIRRNPDFQALTSVIV